MKKELTDRQYKAYHVRASFWVIVMLPLGIVFKILKEIYEAFKFIFTGKIKQKKQLLDGKEIITSRDLIDLAIKKLEERKRKNNGNEKI